MVESRFPIPIILSAQRIGTLVLLYDLGEISERVRLYGGTVLGFVLLSQPHRFSAFVADCAH